MLRCRRSDASRNASGRLLSTSGRHEVSRWRHHWSDYKVLSLFFFICCCGRQGGRRQSVQVGGEGQMGLPHFSPISDLVVLSRRGAQERRGRRVSWVFLGAPRRRTLAKESQAPVRPW